MAATSPQIIINPIIQHFLVYLNGSPKNRFRNINIIQLNILIIIFIAHQMSMQRYKDDSFHMLDTFAKKQMQTTGFGINRSTQKYPIAGEAGSTWDAKHLTNFLNSSHYSNWSQAGCAQTARSYRDNASHKRYSSSGDHFFKTTKDNKNASLIGNTRINPLISSVNTDEHKKMVIKQKLARESPERYVAPKSPMRMDGKFKFQGNSVKFRVTDPLTLNHVDMKEPSNFEKERLLRLIHKRHPHGLTGIDHAETPTPDFYSQEPKQTGLRPIRIRKQPNSGKSFAIDRQWKSKGRVKDDYKDQYRYPKGKITLDRKFRNDNIHGYNILTNRQINKSSMMSKTMNLGCLQNSEEL